MSNLVEFITLTKGIEYLIAIWFVIAFLALWLWVRNRGHVNLVRMLVLMFMAMAIGIGMASCLAVMPN